MKLTVDHFKRLSVSDLRSFDQSMTMWFRVRDNQNNLATALGLGKAKYTKPSITGRIIVPNISERHSSAVLNCTPSKGRLTHAVSEMAPSKIKSVASGDLVKFWQKFQILSPKKEVTSSSNLTEIVRTPVKHEKVEPKNTVSHPITPPPIHPRLQFPASPNSLTTVSEDNRKCIDLNSNSVTKPRANTPPSPSSARKRTRPMSLRKLVTLREHRKKCEQRVRELEAQSRRLRRKKLSKN
uniref:Uncharacterized protein n=1 Tax=Ciona savignyi TaxID=51511 RepID=H2ZNW5_CIOSA